MTNEQWIALCNALKAAHFGGGYNDDGTAIEIDWMVYARAAVACLAQCSGVEAGPPKPGFGRWYCSSGERAISAPSRVDDGDGVPLVTVLAEPRPEHATMGYEGAAEHAAYCVEALPLALASLTAAQLEAAELRARLARGEAERDELERRSKETPPKEWYIAPATVLRLIEQLREAFDHSMSVNKERG